MFKVITIENKQIPMMSNGGTLREYRHFFKRDMLCDIVKLQEGSKKGNFDTEIFENIAWTLAHKANSKIKPIDEWLEQFDDPFSLMNAFSQINELLMSSNKTTVKSKKKNHPKKMKK